MTVLAGGVTTTFAVTHVVGVPLSYPLLALALALFAVGYAAMSRYVFNAGAFWEQDPWHVKLDVLNLTNERWFRARSGDTLGDPLAQAMPDRRWQLTLRFTF